MIKKIRRREWVYVQPPSVYKISCNLCGGEVQWSEYDHMVFCWRCLKDIPGNPGIFDFAIPLEACKLMGICLDRICLKTGKILFMKVKGNKVVWEAGE